jgi:hypothetical protein
MERVDLTVHLAIPAIIDIETTSNVGVPGQWTFRVDLPNIVQPRTCCSMYNLLAWSLDVV